MANINKFDKFPIEREHILCWLLPVIIKYLKSESITLRMRAVTVLVTLMENNPKLQKAAANIGTVTELHNTIMAIENFEKKEEESKVKKLKYIQDMDLLQFSEDSKQEIIFAQSALIAFGYITSGYESIRKKIFEEEKHKTILELTKHPDARIRAAACSCLLFFCRSNKFTKNILISEGILMIIQKLLYDVYLDVEIAAVGTLCNLAIDFQAEICENDICVKRLVELCQSKYFDLRYKAVFGLKNLLFKTTPDIRKFVLVRLGIDKLIGLLDDESVEIQVQTLCTMRNIFHEKQDWVNETLTKFGPDKVLEKIKEKMCCSIPELVLQSLYLLGNITNANDKFKLAISLSSIPKEWIQLLESKNNVIKRSALSSIVNMLRKAIDDSSASKKLRKVFQDLGIEEVLNKLKIDIVPNISKKANQALTYLT